MHVSGGAAGITNASDASTYVRVPCMQRCASAAISNADVGVGLGVPGFEVKK